MGLIKSHIKYNKHSCHEMSPPYQERGANENMCLRNMLDTMETLKALLVTAHISLAEKKRKNSCRRRNGAEEKEYCLIQQ